jgi:tape measure domain-containing protein
MGLELAKAYITIRGDSRLLPGDLDRNRSTVEHHIRQMETLIAGLMTSISALGFTQLYKSLQEAARFEQVTIGFETMIGHSDKAREKLLELSEMAAKTPFTLPGIETSARTLLAMGFNAEELIPTLKSLGDISAGLGGGSQLLFRMAHNLGQVRAQGKLTGREVRDFAIMGVPLIDALSESLGVAKEEIIKLTANSRITSEQVMQAFTNMSKNGGRFFDLMKKQNLSLWGQWSNLRDVITLLWREIGQEFLPVVKALVKVQISIIGGLRDWVTENGSLAASIAVTTTAMTGLTAAIYATRIAVRLLGLTWQRVLASTGIGLAVVALGVALGYLADKLGLFEFIGDWFDGIDESAENAAESIDGTTKAVTNLESTFVKLKGAMGDAFDAMTDGTSTAAEQAKMMKEEYKKLADSLEREIGGDNVYVNTESRFGKIISDARRQKKEFDELVEAFGGGDAAFERMGEFLEKSASIYEDKSKTAAEKWEETKNQLRIIGDLGFLKGADFGIIERELFAKSPLAEAREELRSMEDDIHALEMGFSEADKAKSRFLKLPGADELEDIFVGHQKRLEELQKSREMKEWGKSLVESTKTPVDRAMEEMDKINQLMQMPEEMRGGLTKGAAERRLKELQTTISGRELVGAGRFGFAEFGKQLQDSILKRNSPAERSARANEKQVGQLEILIDTIGNIRERAEGGYLTGGH